LDERDIFLANGKEGHGHRRPVQERSRKTYNLLLDTAGTLLEEVGIERISANVICQRAAVTAPAFYRYFDDKYAILEALAERLITRQNEALKAWIAHYRDSGYDMLVSHVIDLLRERDTIASGQPGAASIMRALRAVPRLSHIRLASHNHVTDLLTDVYQRYLPNIPRDTIRLRTRVAVEIAYSIDEMLSEETIDRERVLQEADYIFRSMYHHPDYEGHLPT
jgi:AcrR family transcriptional regulator